MKDTKIKKENDGGRSIASGRSVKRSFAEALHETEARLETERFPSDDRAHARELAMIIAEVELLPPTALIRIDGNDLDAGLVSEVYAVLTHDHLVRVIDALRETRYRVKAYKTYARTALYNAAYTLALGGGDDHDEEFIRAALEREF